MIVAERVNSKKGNPSTSALRAYAQGERSGGSSVAVRASSVGAKPRSRRMQLGILWLTLWFIKA